MIRLVLLTLLVFTSVKLRAEDLIITPEDRKEAAEFLKQMNEAEPSLDYMKYSEMCKYASECPWKADCVISRQPEHALDPVDMKRCFCRKKEGCRGDYMEREREKYQKQDSDYVR